jgi:hypothetical protein
MDIAVVAQRKSIYSCLESRVKIYREYCTLELGPGNITGNTSIGGGNVTSSIHQLLYHFDQVFSDFGKFCAREGRKILFWI